MGDIFPKDVNDDDIQRARFKNLGQFECMYIMADLKEEILLFSIKYRSSDGLLLIYPDLNNIDANPYLKEIIYDSRNLYQFAMENLSMDCQSEMSQLKNDIELLANKVESISCQMSWKLNLIDYFILFVFLFFFFFFSFWANGLVIRTLYQNTIII